MHRNITRKVYNDRKNVKATRFFMKSYHSRTEQTFIEKATMVALKVCDVNSVIYYNIIIVKYTNLTQ